MELNGKSVTVHDMCLRDGMHAKRHQITVDEMVTVAKAMDNAGIPLIEVTHGDGLGGASVNYGFPAHSDEEYLSAVCREMKNTRVSALLLPGIGTVDHLKMAVDCGISTIRVATHCTEADVAEQHITMAAKIDGLDTVGFLMMAHMAGPNELLVQLKLMEGYGANCVYITDSAGYMLPDDVSERIRLARAELKPETEIGFHGHHNLAMGVANSLAAVEAGARQIECTINGLGERAGNAALEEIVMALTTRGDHYGCRTNINSERLYPTSRLVSNITGMTVQRNKAIVGQNAFAHEAGIHQHGMLQERTTYEIMRPQDVGFVGTNLVLGKHSGRHGFRDRVESLGYSLEDDLLQQVFDDFIAFGR